MPASRKLGGHHDRGGGFGKSLGFNSGNPRTTQHTANVKDFIQGDKIKNTSVLEHNNVDEFLSMIAPSDAILVESQIRPDWHNDKAKWKPWHVKGISGATNMLAIRELYQKGAGFGCSTLPIPTRPWPFLAPEQRVFAFAKFLAERGFSAQDSGSNELLKECFKEFFVKPENRLSFLSAEEIDSAEQNAFVRWRKQLYLIESSGMVGCVTQYEKSLNYWKQLWRVIEKSDLLIQIIDARNPSLFRCAALERVIHDVDNNKQMILLINKSDLLTRKQRDSWKLYFEKRNVECIFYSAKREITKQEMLAKAANLEKNTEEGETTVEETPEEDGDSKQVDAIQDETITEISSTLLLQMDLSPEDSDVLTKEGLLEELRLRKDKLMESKSARFEEARNFLKTWKPIIELWSDETRGSIYSHILSSIEQDRKKNENVTVEQLLKGKDQKADDDNDDDEDDELETENDDDDEDEAEAGDDDDDDDDNEDEGATKKEEVAPITSESAAPVSRGNRVRSVKLSESEFLGKCFSLVIMDKTLPRFHVGTIGFPNVGKSSLINSLLSDSKYRVSVSRTPGHTRHLQTIHVPGEDLVLVDCPGLVFPAASGSREELVVNSIMPIDHYRGSLIGPMGIVFNRVADQIAYVYRTEGALKKLLELNGVVGCDSLSNGMCELFKLSPSKHTDVVRQSMCLLAEKRSFYCGGKGGLPDIERVSRHILKSFCQGTVFCFCHKPPLASLEDQAWKLEEQHKWNQRISAIQ